MSGSRFDEGALAQQLARWADDRQHRGLLTWAGLTCDGGIEVCEVSRVDYRRHRQDNWVSTPNFRLGVGGQWTSGDMAESVKSTLSAAELNALDYLDDLDALLDQRLAAAQDTELDALRRRVMRHVTQVAAWITAGEVNPDSCPSECDEITPGEVYEITVAAVEGQLIVGGHFLSDNGMEVVTVPVRPDHDNPDPDTSIDGQP